MAEKPFRNLGVLSLLVTLVTVGSAVLGFLRELLISSRFGASGETVAFYLLFALIVLSSLSLSTQLPRAFIPMYQGRKLEDPKLGASYFGVTLTLLVPTLCCIALVVFGWTPQAVELFAPGFEGETLDQTVSLARILILILPASAIIAVISSLAQARGHILLVQLTVPLLNLGTIIGLLLFSKWLGIRAAAVGIVLGCFVQLLVLLAYPFFEKLKPRLSREALKPALRGIGILGLLVVLNYSGGTLATVVERLFSSRLSEGHLSCMGYALRLVALPNGVVLRGIIVVMLAAVSDRVVHGDTQAVQRLTLRTLRMLLLVEVPLMLGMALFASPVVQLVYERGAFSTEAAVLTAQLIGCYLPSILSEAVRVVLVTVFFAFSRPATPFAFGLIRVAALALGFSLTWKAFGAPGMALAQSVVDVSLTAALLVLTQRKLGVSFASLGPFLARLSVLTFVGLALAWAVFHGLAAVIVIEGNLLQAIQLLTAVAAAVASALVIAPKLGLSEVEELVTLVRGMLAKLGRRK